MEGSKIKNQPEGGKGEGGKGKGGKGKGGKGKAGKDKGGKGEAGKVFTSGDKKKKGTNKFIFGDLGANVCPSGYKSIKNESTCKKVADELGNTFYKSGGNDTMSKHFAGGKGAVCVGRMCGAKGQCPMGMSKNHGKASKFVCEKGTEEQTKNGEAKKSGKKDTISPACDDIRRQDPDAFADKPRMAKILTCIDGDSVRKSRAEAQGKWKAYFEPKVVGTGACLKVPDF